LQVQLVHLCANTAYKFHYMEFFFMLILFHISILLELLYL
jgi:hypothetical protein